MTEKDTRPSPKEVKTLSSRGNTDRVNPGVSKDAKTPLGTNGKLPTENAPSVVPLPEHSLPQTIDKLKESLRAAKHVINRARQAVLHVKEEIVEVTVGDQTIRVPYSLEGVANTLLENAQNTARRLAQKIEVLEAEQARIAREERLKAQKDKENEKKKEEDSRKSNTPKEVAGQCKPLEIIKDGVVFTVQVMETPEAVTNQFATPTGDNAQLMRAQVRDVMDDGELGDSTRQKTFFQFYKEDPSTEEEKQSKVSLGRLKPTNKSLGHEVCLLTDEELEDLIRERAKAIGKKNQNLEQDISLIIKELQKPDMQSILKLKSNRNNTVMIHGQRKPLFRFSPVGVLPKLPFKYPEISERIRVSFAVHTVEESSRQNTRVIVDLLHHDDWDKEHRLGGLAHHR